MTDDDKPRAGLPAIHPVYTKPLTRQAGDRGQRCLKACELMVLDGLSLDDAAKAVGVPRVVLRRSINHPATKRRLAELREVLLTSATAGNIRTLLEVRDRKGGNAANDRNRITAVQVIEDIANPGQRGGGVNVNVGVAVTMPGYRISMPADRAERAQVILHHAGSEANVLETND